MEQATEVVRARRVEIVDGAGVVRAVLGTDRDEEAGWDSVSLSLFSPDGAEHVTVYAETEVAGVELWEGGNTVAALHSNREGRASVIVADHLTADLVFKADNEGGVVKGGGR